MEVKMSVCVRNLANLQCEWVKLPMPEEDLNSFTQNIRTTPDDELLIVGHEDGLIPYSLMSDNVEELNRDLTLLDSKSEEEQTAVISLMNAGFGFDSSMELVDKGNYTMYSDLDCFMDLVDQLLDEGYWGNIPHSVRDFLDKQEMKSSLEDSGWVYIEKTRCAICSF